MTGSSSTCNGEAGANGAAGGSDRLMAGAARRATLSG